MPTMVTPELRSTESALLIATVPPAMASVPPTINASVTPAPDTKFLTLKPLGAVTPTVPNVTPRFAPVAVEENPIIVIPAPILMFPKHAPAKHNPEPSMATRKAVFPELVR